MIKGIVTGVDNFLVRKDAPLEDQDLSELKGKIKDLKESGIRFYLVTGRSLESSAELLESLCVTDVCGFEMGLQLYNPLTYESMDLLDYTKLVSVKSALDLTRDNLFHNKSRIEERLGEEISYLHDRKRIITFETITKSGFDLYQILREIIPEYVSRLIAKGEILMFPSSKAVDIMPNLTKGDAALAIAKMYGLSPGELLACGVSYHTDDKMFKSCGYTACSQNADKATKSYLSTRKNGNFYISPFEYTEGAVDVLRKEW